MNRPPKRSELVPDPEPVEYTMHDNSLVGTDPGSGVEPGTVPEPSARAAERGAGVVEWLGISALSIGMLVVLFTAMEALGLDVVSQIRGSLGL